MVKRVLVCTNVYPPNFIGGAELIAHQYAKTLKGMGHEVIVFAGDIGAHGERHSMLVESYDGMIVFRVCLTNEDFAPDKVNFVHRKVEEHFDTVLELFHPDVVHFNNLIGLSAGLIHRAKIRGIETALTVHDHWGFCLKNTLLRKDGSICDNSNRCHECMRFIYNDSGAAMPVRMRKDFLSLQMDDIDIFISPSKYLARAYIKAGFPDEKFHVIEYGLDIKRFSGTRKVPGNGKVRFTFIGYLGEHKGVHVLINALRRIDKRRMTLNIAGDGALMDTYRQQVRSLGLEDTVKFWGKVADIERIYAQTDVLILPSIWPENQPLTIIEAMSSGIPVIASDIGGIPELVDDGIDGYLFSPGDDEALAGKMSDIIARPDILKKLGNNAYKKVRGYQLKEQALKVLQAYDERHIKAKGKQNTCALIVCSGNGGNPQFAGAMNDLSQAGVLRRYRFVAREWLSPERMRDAKVLWVLPREMDWDTVILGLSNMVPLLVPEDNEDLKNLCTVGNCGFYYSNVNEALAYIHYLIDHEEERTSLGKKGQDLYTGSLPSNGGIVS